MNCSEVNGLLDQLMDGELSDEQRQAVEAHGRECAECAAAIRATWQLKALFDEMPQEEDVPLEAQAKWRGAVREASRQARQKTLRRWIATAAAAVVALVGVSLTFALRGAPKQSVAAPLAIEEAEEAAPRTASNALESAAVLGAANGQVEPAASAVETDGAVVESDGMADETVNDEQRVVTWELAIQVEDTETACARILDLIQEYEGTADVQAVGDDGANIYVDISADNAADFLNAVVPMDRSGQAVQLPESIGDGHLQMLLVVHQ